MRRLIVLGLVLLFPPALRAQPGPLLEISGVRVGFPPSVFIREDGPASYFKAGSWTPVFVDITAGKTGLKGTEGKVRVAIETEDNDQIETVYTTTVPLPPLPPGQSFTVQAYTKPASTLSVITTSLRSAELATGPSVRRDTTGLDTSQALYLLVGSDLPGLRGALEAARAAAMNDQALPGGMPPNFGGNDLPFEFVAVADSPDKLPEHWFGYESVDLVVLTTGRRDFLDQLAAEPRRRQALAQWVLRGGHLLISAGRNQDAVARLAELESLLPVRLAGLESRPNLRLDALAPKHANLAGPVEAARLEPKPDRSLHRIISPDAGEPLLVAQGPAGLGRVTVVAFDIDQKPFAAWPGKDELLLALLGQAWPRAAYLASDRNPDFGGPNFGGPGWQGNDLMVNLYNDLEDFEEVPVISFGWVALFIFIYILIVGPLDYWFLKYVVKRLELTWITFPTVVILISVIAYFTAYQIKGKDLRMRKLDVVDVDLSSQQIYGRTWLTIFSPRIDHYTIGLQPAAVGGDGPVVMSWLGRPVYERNFAPFRSQSLFRRSYDYAPNAAGLEGVPIQVWMTKSFTAAWSQPLPASPPVSANLFHPADNPNQLAGSIVWRPETKGGGDASLDLADARLIYRGRVYPLPLAAGTLVPVDVQAQVGGIAVPDWLASSFPGADNYMHAVLFFREAQGARAGRRNHGLRELDQSWRLTAAPEEAILVGRMKARQGPANDVNSSPATPSRLWLGALPSANAEPPPLAGILRQDTWVRVFIPIQAGKKE